MTTSLVSGDVHDCTGTWIQKRADLRELTADAKAKAVTTVNVRDVMSRDGRNFRDLT